jgi:glycosyltransferase involved in cell wall biosynthesis
MGAREDMWNVLPDYDLFVMPSLYEGCPNAVIEAMAMGLPALLSDIPVMREVSHGNALFFDPEKPSSFVKVMNGIEKGEVDLRAMGAKGVELVRANHVKEQYVERLNSLYASAVAGSGIGRAGARR